jgi:hypothetical protein
MKAKIKSAEVEMIITGENIEEMLSRFIYYAKASEQPLGETIEIKIKTKTQLKKHGIYAK